MKLVPSDYRLIDDTPKDAYGPDYWLKQIRDGFEALVEMKDYDFASKEVAAVDFSFRHRRYRNVG